MSVVVPIIPDAAGFQARLLQQLEPAMAAMVRRVGLAADQAQQAMAEITDGLEDTTDAQSLATDLRAAFEGAFDGLADGLDDDVSRVLNSLTTAIEAGVDLEEIDLDIGDEMAREADEAGDRFVQGMEGVGRRATAELESEFQLGSLGERVEIPVEANLIRNEVDDLLARTSQRQVANVDVLVDDGEVDTMRSTLDQVVSRFRQLQFEADVDVPLDELNEASRVAQELRTFSASLDVDVPPEEIERALSLARDLNNFTARIDVEVDQGPIDSQLGDTGKALLDVEFDVDDSKLRQAIDLADRLSGFVATLDIDADQRDLRDAKDAADLLDGFIARMDLDVDGQNELREVLGVADALRNIRGIVDLQISGDFLTEADRQLRSLERDREVRFNAVSNFDDLTAEARAMERTRRVLVDVDVDDSDLDAAFRLADRLATFSATVDINTDEAELDAALRTAEQLDRFIATLDLDVRGEEDLREALRLGNSIDAINAQVNIRTRDDSIRSAIRLLDRTESTRTADINVPLSPIRRAQNELDRLAEPLATSLNIDTSGAESSFGSLIDGLSFANLGDQVSSALRDALATTGPLGVIAGTAGIALGGLFAQGFATALAREPLVDLLGASVGATDAQSKVLGRQAADLYIDGYVTTFEEGSAVIRDATVLGVDEVLAGQAAAVGRSLGLVSGEILELGALLERQGLVDNIRQGTDLFITAAQRVPTAMVDPLRDAIIEYGKFFDDLGFSAEESFSVLGDAALRGQFELDKTGDALKEFTVLLNEGAEENISAFETLGFGLEQYRQFQTDVAAGGPAAREAFSEMAVALLSVEDAVERAALARELFGTPLEDIDVNSFLSSLASAELGLDGFAGATERFANQVTDNLDTRLRGLRAEFDGIFVDIGFGVTAVIDGESGAEDFKRAGAKAAELFSASFESGLDIAFVSVPQTVFDLVSEIDILEPITVPIRLIADAAFGGEEPVLQSAVAGEQFGVTSEQLLDQRDVGSLREMGAAYALLDEAGRKAADAMGEVGSEAEEQAKSFAELQVEITGTIGDLRRLEGLGGGEVMRGIATDAEALIEAFEALDEGTVDQLGNFDRYNESARGAEEALEGIRSRGIDAAEAFAEGRISSLDFVSAQREISDAVTIAGQSFGASGDQLAAWQLQYGGLSESVREDLTVNITAQLAELGTAERAIRGLAEIEPVIRARFDLDGDLSIDAAESAGILEDLEATVRLGFEFEGDEDEQFLARAQALDGLQFLATLGFDTDFSGETSATERADAFSLIRSFAEIGFDIDDDGLLSAEEELTRISTALWLAEIGMDIDPFTATSEDVLAALAEIDAAEAEAEASIDAERALEDVEDFLRQIGLVKEADVVATLDADSGHADDVLAKLLTQLGVVDAEEFVADLFLNADDADTKLADALEGLEALDGYEATANVDASLENQDSLADYLDLLGVIDAQEVVADVLANTAGTEQRLADVLTELGVIDATEAGADVLANDSASGRINAVMALLNDLDFRPPAGVDITANDRASFSIGSVIERTIELSQQSAEVSIGANRSAFDRVLESISATVRNFSASIPIFGRSTTSSSARGTTSGSTRAPTRSSGSTSRSSGSLLAIADGGIISGQYLALFDGGTVGRSVSVGPAAAKPASIAQRFNLGGALDGIAPPTPGGVPGVFNRQPFIMAENAGSELFVNSRSSFDRQLDLIQTFDNGSLDRALERHYAERSVEQLADGGVLSMSALDYQAFHDGGVIDRASSFVDNSRTSSSQTQAVSPEALAAAVRAGVVEALSSQGSGFPTQSRRVIEHVDIRVEEGRDIWQELTLIDQIL